MEKELKSITAGIKGGEFSDADDKLDIRETVSITLFLY